MRGLECRAVFAWVGLVRLRLFRGVYAGKKVLITGHTGFKGGWLALWLHDLGAKVVGFSLAPDTTPSLCDQLRLSDVVESHIGDIRDPAALNRVFESARPEIVFHLAAQPLVRSSYRDPVETFSTNVLGTAHLLEAVRNTDSVKVCLAITSDKCYENPGAGAPCREGDRLGGHDPYSASKACAEMVVASYRQSFFTLGKGLRRRVGISTARAGNVLGGGDWAEDRMMPDCIRALSRGEPIHVRNPEAVRPWQYVLEPLSGYLHLCARQHSAPADYDQAWNFGPKASDSLRVRDIVRRVIEEWGGGEWRAAGAGPDGPHEAAALRLNCRKANEKLGWKPVYSTAECVASTVGWYKASVQKKRFDARECTRAQIHDYVERARGKGLAWATGR